MGSRTCWHESFLDEPVWQHFLKGGTSCGKSGKDKWQYEHTLYDAEQVFKTYLELPTDAEINRLRHERNWTTRVRISALQKLWKQPSTGITGKTEMPSQIKARDSRVG